MIGTKEHKTKIEDGLDEIDSLRGTFLSDFIGQVSCGYVTTASSSSGTSSTGKKGQSKADPKPEPKPKRKGKNKKPEAYQQEDVMVVDRSPPVEENIAYAPCRDLAHYEESTYVKWGEYKLSPYVHFVTITEKYKERVNGKIVQKSRKVEKRYEKLSISKGPYVQNLRQSINYYMPEDELMKVVAALDQRKYPMAVERIKSMPDIINGFKKWPKIFHYDDITEEQMVEELNELARVLKEDVAWCFLRHSTPTNFWNKLLISANLSTNLKKLIEATLTIPYGSAGMFQ